MDAILLDHLTKQHSGAKNRNLIGKGHDEFWIGYMGKAGPVITPGDWT